MFYTGLFKRIIPFVLTFAAGLLLASIFVSVTPDFSGWRSERRRGRCHEKKQLAIENETLRERLRATQDELHELRRGMPDQDVELDHYVVPPVTFEEHHPPPPPKRPKNPRATKIQ